MNKFFGTTRDVIAFFITLLIGLFGAGFAILSSIPAPYLAGPTLAVATATFLGFRPYVPPNITNLAFVIIGIMMGSTITPDVLVTVKTWPLSFLAVVIATYVFLYSAYWLLKHVFGYHHNTAMLAASPGHLSYVLSLASTVKTDLPSIGLIQSIRLLALTLSVPLIVDYLDLVDVSLIIQTTPMPLLALIITIAAALLLGKLFLRWGFPAALLLGGVVISGATHLSGIVHGAVPEWLSLPTYIYLGCMIGARFKSFSGEALKKALIAGCATTILVVVLAVIFALIVAEITAIPLNAVMIAFAPGGLETMSAMAIMMHADTAYVGAHHILRLAVLTFLMPFVLHLPKKT